VSHSRDEDQQLGPTAADRPHRVPGSLFWPWLVGLIFLLSWLVLFWWMARRKTADDSHDKEAPEGEGRAAQVLSKFRSPRGIIRFYMWLILIYFGLFFLLIDSTPWLPPENVEIQGMEQPLTAYVLNDDPAALVLLSEPERRLVRLPTSTINSRQFCRRTWRSAWRSAQPWADWLYTSRTVVSVLVSPPNYPKCVS
jgi:hypothetical protein